jgi:hypothetical protein
VLITKHCQPWPCADNLVIPPLLGQKKSSASDSIKLPFRNL